MLRLNAVSKCYGDNKVLLGVELIVKPGSCACVAGGNAVGKTTLLSIAAGMQRPDSGSVEGIGQLGYVPQHNALQGDLTVRDNLLLWYTAAGRSGRELMAPGSPEEALGLAPVAKKRVSRLSGGYQKRVAIATAMACRPEFLLLDEPFAALDIHSRDNAVGLLLRFLQAGGGILFSSHDPAVVARLADEIYFIKNGTVDPVVRLSRTESPETRARTVLEVFYRMIDDG